ncbi:sulfotransferase [soil metagenome]
MRKPDIFLVGAARCGTTSMYRYLGQHPQVFAPHKKEPCHFATDLDSGSYQDSRYFIRDRAEYLGLFAPAKTDQTVLDGSVWHLYSRVAAQEIARFAPDGRILIMLRNPLDMMYSWHARRVMAGAEDVTDFEVALAAEPERKAGRRIPPASFLLPALFYREVASFSEQVERYRASFPAERICIVIFDDFQRDTLGTYRDVLRFLGLRDDFQPSLEVGNPSKTVRSPVLRDVLRNPRLHSFSNRLVPAPVWRRVRPLFKGIHEMNRRDESRAAMDIELRRRLEREFEPEVQRLGELVGRNLAALWFARERAPSGVGGR